MPEKPVQQDGTLDLRSSSLAREAKGEVWSRTLAMGHQRNQFHIARLIVIMFSFGFFAALAVISYTIVRDTYDESYLTILSTIGVLWGSVIGSVAGFYFAKQSGESWDEI